MAGGSNYLSWFKQLLNGVEEITKLANTSCNQSEQRHGGDVGR